jgi:hypothetical protein
MCFLWDTDKPIDLTNSSRMMDNVQNCYSYINIPLSQTYRQHWAHSRDVMCFLWGIDKPIDLINSARTMNNVQNCDSYIKSGHSIHRLRPRRQGSWINIPSPHIPIKQFASTSSTLPCIPLQSPVCSVGVNIDNDNHITVFAYNKCFVLYDNY